jgi:hypothetical protein
MPIRLTQVGNLRRDLRMIDLPQTLLEFQQLFPNETACTRHMERIRWPEGFECPSCWPH